MVIGMTTYHAATGATSTSPSGGFIEPFGGHTWTQMAVYRIRNDKSDQVDAYKSEKIAIKQTYHIKVNLTGQLPANLKQARVEVDGQIHTDSSETIERADGAAYFVKKFDVSAKGQKFKFRIVYNDGAFPARTGVWHEVEVLPEPKLVALDNQPSPQITLFPPAYTDLPERRLPPGVRNMEMFQGTRVLLRAKADRPLKEAWLIYEPRQLGRSSRRWSSAPSGKPIRCRSHRRRGRPWARIPVSLEDDGSVMSQFRPLDRRPLRPLHGRRI